MNEQQAAEAIKDWIIEVVPEIKSGYSYDPGSRFGELPDVTAVCESRRVVPTEPEFPESEVEGNWLIVFPVEVIVMADLAESEDEARTRQEWLEGVGATLSEALLTDASLGGRLDPEQGEVAARPHTIEYGEAFRETPDGTRGRALRGSFQVGGLITEPA